jgi:hypothetical protein
MCKSQTFVRGEGGAIVLKARIRKAEAEPVKAAMPVPPPGQEINVPGVVRKGADLPPPVEPVEEVAPVAPPKRKAAFWEIY